MSVNDAGQLTVCRIYLDSRRSNLHDLGRGTDAQLYRLYAVLVNREHDAGCCESLETLRDGCDGVLSDWQLREG
jgi:hypothetical protein